MFGLWYDDDGWLILWWWCTVNLMMMMYDILMCTYVIRQYEFSNNCKAKMVF